MPKSLSGPSPEDFERLSFQAIIEKMKERPRPKGPIPERPSHIIFPPGTTPEDAELWWEHFSQDEPRD